MGRLCLLAVVFYFYFPVGLGKLGRLLIKDSEPTKFLYAIAPAVLVFSLSTLENLLRPSDNVAKELTQWSGYRKLWNRGMFSLAVLIVSAVCSIGTWLFATEFQPILLGLVLTLCVSEACVTALTLILAELMIRRIFDEAG